MCLYNKVLFQAITTGVLGLLLVWTSPALAQQSDEQKRLDQLEQELEQLKEAMATSAATEPKGLSDENRAKLKEKNAAADHVTYSSEWQVGKPKDYLPDQGWIGITGSQSEIKLWGWVQTALFHDFQENLLNDVQEFSTGLVPVPTGDNPTSGFDMASSRIFIQSRHLLKGNNAVQVLFVMDGGGNDPFGGYDPRVRQFNVTINNLTFGKAAGTFANTHAWPAYFDRGAPGAYALSRKPVARYAIPLNKEDKGKSIFTIALEDPTPKILDLEAAAADPKNAAADTTFEYPDIVARYDWNPSWGNLMWAGIARNFKVNSMNTAASTDEWTWGLTMSGFVTTRKSKDRGNDHVKFGFVGGPGIGGYTWDSGFGLNDAIYVDSTQTLETLDILGGFAAYEAYWSKRFFSVFMLSRVEMDNIAIQPTASLKTADTATVTFMYTPWADMFVGLEYFYGERTNLDGLSGYDNRVNLVLRYMFNR